MLKSFQIHAIQQALVTAGLHYHLPTGIWDNDTLQSYQQFHAVVLFQPAVHLLQQPHCITAVCAELLQLAGLIGEDGSIIDHDEEDPDATDADNEQSNDDDTDGHDVDDAEEDDINPEQLPGNGLASEQGSVVLPDGVAKVEDLQSQFVDPNFQLNESEIAQINGDQGQQQEEQQQEEQQQEEQAADQQEEQEESDSGETESEAQTPAEEEKPLTAKQKRKLAAAETAKNA